ncbi:MAG: DNA polymerase IV [Candidatus Bathyarchaeota archaeon]|nr:MAG: DNA polymerase IV [Candidatus Bathyarchaeota archaeon]
MTIPRVVLHVDFDYFFAQVEERENSAIRNQPVVVCVYSGRGGDHGAVSTANYVARKYGVRSGMPIIYAKKRLKNVEAVFLPVNRVLYDKVSENIMNVLCGYADNFEQVGVDEAFLDVTKRVGGNYERGQKLASEIKKRILAEEKITCSIGVGPNKLVAKIAANSQKPNGLTVVSPAEVQSFLASLSVRELVGVGRKTEDALKKLGIETNRQLATYDVTELISVFGKTLGMYLHNASLGVDESPVEQRGRAESVSRIVTLKENTRDLTVMMREVDKLAKDILKAVEQGLSFRSISISAVMEDLSMVTRSKTFQRPVENLEDMKKAAGDLLVQLLRKETERLVRRIGLKISSFIEEKGQKRLKDFDMRVQ